MSVYKVGDVRGQSDLMPRSLDEYVGADNLVRAIDGYVEMLDVFALGFSTRSSDALDGQPAYHPVLLLKIYLYGYINRIRSSRRLECEIGRNVEMMWLTQRLRPSYKTIADFRKNNKVALKRVFQEFVLLCGSLDLLGGELVAVDGAYLRANASRNQLIMRSTIEKKLRRADEKIATWLSLLDDMDERGDGDGDMPLALDKLEEQRRKLAADLALLDELNKNQHNRTDGDASLMRKPGQSLVAYNSQIAVDDKHKLIVATDVSSVGNDKAELHNMGMQAKAALAVETLDVVADCGYDSPKEIKKCLDDGINPIVPRAKTGNSAERNGKFARHEFTWDANAGQYICPNGARLTRASAVQHKNGKVNHIYRAASATCAACPLRRQCLPDRTRRKQIYRWEHEAVIETHNESMRSPRARAIIKRRGSIVEHPFGSIKIMLGWEHYLLRGRAKVGGENALIMLAYNFKRVLNIIGVVLFTRLATAQPGELAAVRREIAAHIAARANLHLFCAVCIAFYTRLRLFCANLRTETECPAK